MANSKRKRIRSNPTATRATAPAATFTTMVQPAAFDSRSASAAQRAAASQASLEAEQQSLSGRRALVIGLVIALLLLIPALYLIQQLIAGRAAAPTAAIAPPAPTIVPTTAPAAAVLKPTAAPAVVIRPTVVQAAAVEPTVVPAAAVVAAPTAVPAAPVAAAPAAQASAAPASSNQCFAITGLPAYDGASCIGFDTDEDDGVIRHESTYATNAAVDDVRRFYEAAFAANGWTVTEFKQDVEDNTWEYQITQGLHRAEVKVQPELTPNGVVTKIKINEK